MMEGEFNMDELFNNDEFDEKRFEKFIKRLFTDSDTEKPVRKIIVNNTEPKSIGDRVEILDFSSLSNKNGEEVENIEEIDENVKYYIVIETNEKFKFKNYVQDVVIVNPKNNEQYRIASRHLKIYRRF